MVVATEMFSMLRQWVVDPRVLEALEGTGFPEICHLAEALGKNTHHDNKMLSALVKCYDKDSMCFRVGGHTLFYGLEDILLATGLRVEGKLVIKGEVSIQNVPDNPDVVFVKGLGLVHRNLLDHTSVKLIGLRNAFQTIPNDVEVDSDRFGDYVRAYALYVLGTVLMATTDHECVSLTYLESLSNIREIKNHAWGVAVLAHIHYSLGLHVKAKKEKLGGHLYFLMVWALEHLPTFRRELVGDKEIPKDFPLAIGWARLTSEALKNKSKEKKYEELLAELWDNPTNVEWQPYARLDDLPEAIRSQRRMRTYRGILVHPRHKMAFYHCPDICPMKLGLKNFDVGSCRPLLEKRDFRNWKAPLAAWQDLEKCFLTELATSDDTRASPTKKRSRLEGSCSSSSMMETDDALVQNANPLDDQERDGDGSMSRSCDLIQNSCVPDDEPGTEVVSTSQQREGSCSSSSMMETDDALVQNANPLDDQERDGDGSMSRSCDLIQNSCVPDDEPGTEVVSTSQQRDESLKPSFFDLFSATVDRREQEYGRERELRKEFCD